MNAVFADTVGLIAVWKSNDQWHQTASAAFERLRVMGTAICTTDLILAECGNALARSQLRDTLLDFKDQLEMQGLLIIPNDRDWQLAWQAYRRGDANNAGLVDLTSFAVMRRFGLTDAFTNDNHFRAAGLNVLF